ncbi:hypothetical protein SFC28_10445 [Staphylococcus hominis]
MMTCQTIKYISIPIVITIGASTAFILYRTLKNKKVKNPDRILEEVKSYFMDIKGSYILHEPLQNKEQYLNRLVYQGGITQNKNNRDIEYTFYADAHTSEILTIEEN